MTKGIIKGSEFNYIIDTSYGLSSDGYIATGTESIVYKGLKNFTFRRYSVVLCA